MSVERVRSLIDKMKAREAENKRIQKRCEKWILWCFISILLFADANDLLALLLGFILVTILAFSYMKERRLMKGQELLSEELAKYGVIYTVGNYAHIKDTATVVRLDALEEYFKST